jgi:hypothetical protein
LKPIHGLVKVSVDIDDAHGEYLLS